MSPLQHVPTAEDLKAAQARIAAYVHRTPVFQSQKFDNKAGASVIFKGEHLQKTGAFKARGAMNAVLINQEHAKGRGFVTHSSGNQGAALAWAASNIGEKAHIIMPSNAPKAKIEAVRSYGGIIEFCAPTLDAREQTAKAVEEKEGAFFVHPYDNYDIIAGQATATMELLEEHPDLKYLFVPVGGGGLLSGAALANAYFGSAKLIGCEPTNASDAHESFYGGHWVPVTTADTIADGLKTSLGKRNFPIIQAHVDEISLVTEAEITDAWHFVLARLKQFIEPSAATGVAACLKKSLQGKAGIMLCGGNMDTQNWALR